MADKKNVPQIRISQFAKEWNKALLSFYLETSKVKNFDESFAKEDVLSVSGDAGVVNQMEYQGKSFAGASLVNYGVVSTNDVVYTKSPLRYQPYGIIKTNTGDPGIVSALYAVYHPKETVYAPFVQTYFELDKRLNSYLLPIISKGAKNTINVGDDAALLGTVSFPEYDEQQAITNIFSNLEALIVQSQSKLEKLQNLKSSMLEKMFPKDGTETPEVRFKGFEGAWERRKLNELVDRVVRKNSNNESSLPLTISAQYGLVDQITYFNSRVASRDVTNYYLVLNGEFAYNKSSSDGFPFGTVKRLDFYDKGVLSTLYIVFSIKDYKATNSDYLAVFFDTDRWHKGVAARAAEGARNHGLLNISADDFLDIDILVPKEESEQGKIGAYFYKLDKLITLHRQELNKLQNMKKALLEKMFV